MGESMAGLVRSHMCGAVDETCIGQTVTVMGWVQRRRDMSGRYFIILRDRTDIVQIVADEKINEEIFKKAKDVKSEYVLAVKGKVIARTEENINPAMKTGKIEIECQELRILSESQTPPFHIEAGSQAGLDLRLKYRYLDLRRPDLYQNMYLRHKAAQAVRRYYADHGFLEIETPMLTKSTPEGARDYLVPSRVHPGNFYALPQSPQVLKQLLMVSGMDRYFQIVKCFRDEDLRADRQPEFTQIDLEMSFVDESDVMSVNEGLIKTLFKELMDLDIATPFKRMTYKEAMERFGSDKPDVRFGMELKDISQVVRGCEFVVFANALEAGGSVRGFNAKGCASMGRKQIDKLVDFVKDFGAKGLAWIHVQENGEIKSQIAKFFTEEKLQEIVAALDGQPGDLLLICADQNKVVFDALGNLRLEVAKKQNMIPEGQYEFLWVTEFPLLEWDEEDGRYVALHHPFTAPMEEDLPMLDTEPAKVRARAYDMVLNGVELGGGSIRIHQQDIQSKMFQLLGFTEESAQASFGFLLEAFQYGVPPHGGLAFGFDRIMMLMTGSDSIRDVIAFPKVKDASCPMTKAPTPVTAEQLEELGITVIPQEEPVQE